MIGLDFSDNFDLFWRYYFGGDIGYSFFEAPGSNSITPREVFPWQAFGGLAYQVGDLRNLEFFIGAGYSTEFYQRLIGVETYTMEKTHSVRAHLGLTYRFISLVGATAQLMLRYSLPVLRVTHFNEPLYFNGIIDATLRWRFHYDSDWSLFGGIRFEDYETAGESITYFNTRIHAGLGIHF